MTALRIVGVHGVGNHRPLLSGEQAASELAGRWAAAITPALGEANRPCELACAYYAPHLNQVISQSTGDGLDDLDQEQWELLAGWAEQLGVLPADVAQGYLTLPARWIVHKIAESRLLDPALLCKFVAVFLREVHTYLRQADSAARTGARDTVAATIRTHHPHVVIAHSLGSVVTYEALCAHPDLRVDLLITIGSPLGMRGVVFDRLQPKPAGEHGHRPPTVGRWVNIADPGDVVAIPRPFTLRFRPDHNDERTPIGTFDFHRAIKYLSAPPTIQAIVDYRS